MSSEFNCDFDAPMFVDFENLDQEGNPDDFFGKLKKKLLNYFWGSFKIRDRHDERIIFFISIKKF